MTKSKIPPKARKLLIFLILLLVGIPASAQTLRTNPDSIPFAPAVNYWSGDGPEYVFCADLDNDYDLDLAVANLHSGNVSILKNNGDGTFQTAVYYGAGDWLYSVFCADLDNDNDLDLAVAYEFYNYVSILKNNGDGTFQTAVNYGAGDGPFSVFCADLDNDNDLDLAVTNIGSDNVSILKNNGDGTFQPKVDYGAGDYPISVFCADLDNDNDLDLAVANDYSDNVSILKNNGDGTFQTAVNYDAGDGPQSVFCADLDNDNDLDLAVANTYSHNVFILENNGDGTFQLDGSFVAGSSPRSVFCADLDGDTDLDLAVANWNSDNVSILKNNGDGTFQPKVGYGAGEYPRSVFCADLDNDGDLDLAVANFQSDNVSILINLSGGENQSTLVLKDGSASHNPIAYKSFKIFKVTNNPPTMPETYLGELTTDGNGKITLPQGWFNQGEWVKVERLVYTQPAVKHTNILPNMYYVKLDNAKFNTTTGAISYFPFSSEPEQEVIVDHTTVMFDLLISVEWDADLAFLQNLLEGFRYVSNYLYDVTDGQLCLDTVRIYDSKVNWNLADVWIHASNMEWPRATVYLGNGRLRGGIFGSGNQRLYFPRIFYFNNEDVNRNLTYSLYPYDWTIDQTSYPQYPDRAYPPSRTLAHEFGHYGIGFMDEYCHGPCTPVIDNVFPGNGTAVYDFGLMDDQLKENVAQNSEMSCTAIQYSDLAHQVTYQWTERGNRSCWDYFQWDFQGTYDGIFAPINMPMAQMFTGPNDAMQNLNYDVGSLIPSTGAIINYIDPQLSFTVTVQVLDQNNQPIPRTDVVLRKLFRDIPEGQTADAPNAGLIRCLGFRFGDIIQAATGRIVIVGKGEEEWLFGEGELPKSGVSRFANAYRTSLDGDSLDLFLRAVVGNYPLIYGTSLSTGTPEYILTTTQPFSANPTLELHPDDYPDHNYTMNPNPTGYSSSIPDSMGSSGMFSLLALDDSSYTFFVNTPYSFTQIIDTSFIDVVIGPQGGCELHLDNLNTNLEKILILSSSYPPIRTGLDPESEQGGEIYSLSSYPSVALLGSNNLIIRYADSDLLTQSEATLEVFKWNESLQKWEELCGFIDTENNIIGANINSLGIYGAFTAGYLRGDANGSGLIELGDVVYLITYLYKNGPAPIPLLAGDANCSGEVELGEVVYLITYLYKAGPPPCK